MGPASLCQWCFFDCGGRRQRATQAASSASRAVASVRKLGKRHIGEPGCRLLLSPGRLCPLRIPLASFRATEGPIKGAGRRARAGAAPSTSQGYVRLCERQIRWNGAPAAPLGGLQCPGLPQ